MMNVYIDSRNDRRNHREKIVGALINTRVTLLTIPEHHFAVAWERRCHASPFFLFAAKQLVLFLPLALHEFANTSGSIFFILCIEKIQENLHLLQFKKLTCKAFKLNK